MSGYAAGLLTGVWGMGMGYLMFRYGPKLLQSIQTQIVANAEKVGAGGLFRVLAKAQVVLLKVASVIFFLAGVAALIITLLDAVGLISVFEAA